MTMEAVFITGVGRSGSTLMDLVLGSHPRFVGLGEVWGLLRSGDNRLHRADEEICSCGAAMTRCEFWGPLVERLKESRSAPPEEKYRLVLDAFREAFGDDRVPVDSSKDPEAFRALMRSGDVNVKAVYIIRDVRSWTVSMRDARRRRGQFRLPDLVRKYGLLKTPYYFVRRLPSALFWRWYLVNRSVRRALREGGVEHVRVSYEELAIRPEPVIARICEFLGVKATEQMLTPALSGSHSVGGNRMRSQKSKRSGISYDNRWFSRRDWLIPFLLFPNIARFNTREVYPRRQDLWKR